jgi:hypothetical protein
MATYKKQYSMTDMEESYRLSGNLIRDTLPQNDYDALNRIGESNIVVIPGTYDSVQDVLKRADVPCLIGHSNTLDTEQIVLVNCPGRGISVRFGRRNGLSALVAFVEAGGYLMTTDWALQEVISRGFPGAATRGHPDTRGNDHVEIDFIKESRYTRGLGTSGTLRPMWWLEPSSYPINLGSRHGVEVLLDSTEMGRKYGGYSPIAIKFNYGAGKVVHVTSHFKLQQSVSKYEEQAKLTGIDFATTFMGISKQAARNMPGLEEMGYGAMESAYFSLRFLLNIILEKVCCKVKI